MADNGTLLKMQQVTKTFPGVVAVDKVDFDVKYGEVHALVGENGAGKSTLIKILGGVYDLEEGSMLFDGEEVLFASTHQSQTHGISVIHLSFSHGQVADITLRVNLNFESVQHLLCIGIQFLPVAKPPGDPLGFPPDEDVLSN